MSKKRFVINDKDGNRVDYDISSDAVTLDDESKTLTEKIEELEEDIANAQATLVSGENISTINGNSLLSGDDITVDDGKSAYEVAVENGYTGSEAEWLESLKGDSGVASADGIVSVNDLNGGRVDTNETVYVLGANMGKQLALLVEAYQDRLDAVEEAGGVIAQVVGTKLIISRTTDPLVIVGDLSRSTISAKAAQTQSAVFYLSGRNLTGNITVSVSDTTNFAVPVATFTPTDGTVNTTAVTVNYTPAAGTASGTTHACVITVTYNNTAYGTLNLSGTVVESSSLAVTPATLALSAVSGEQSSGTITVDGTALDGDVTLTLAGTTGFSFDSASIDTEIPIAKADAEAGEQVTVYYTAGASNENGTITAATTGVTSVIVNVSGTVAEPLPVGAYFIIDGLKYTVLTSSTVSVACDSAEGAVTIPDTISDAGVTATLSDSSTQEGAGVTYDVVSIPNKGFWYKTAVTSIVVGSNVTSIGDKFIQGGTHLESVVLPSSLTTIGGEAFSNCSVLTGINLPTSLTSLGGMAFMGCSSITHAELPNIGSLRTYTFNGCASLQSVLVGSQVGTLNNQTFVGCSSLTDLTLMYDGVVGALDASAIFTLDDNGKVAGLTIHVPSNQVSAYQSNAFWSAIIEDVNTNIVAIS